MDSNKNHTTADQRELLFGKNKSFAAAEAYKLLRTNVAFSFSAENECPVIGVTSSMRGEGKSTTSVNMSYTFAESGKRVLLVEGDMRLPSIPDKLGLNLSPGLSNLLVEKKMSESVVQHFGDMKTLDILTAGDVPPNPSELLGSQRMQELISTARTQYDYIILDLPPVTAVSDAVSISKLLDGILIVVRGNYAEKGAVKETLRQLGLVGVKVLGFVYTYATTSSKSYGKKYGKSKHKYGYESDYGYGYGYGQNNTQKAQAGISAKADSRNGSRVKGK